MIISNRENKTVFVISGNGGSCPRISIARNVTHMKDDYRGKITVGKALLNKLADL